MRLFEGTPFDIPPRCDRCGELEDACACPPPEPACQYLPPGQQTATVSVEKRKKGKQVTVVRGLAPEANPLAELLTRLKQVCGAGGTLKDDLLEIQGQHLQRVADCLSQLGYRVRTRS